ncbi:glycosyltransferase [Vibrio cholerae]
MEKNKVLFFAHVKDKNLFKDISFYEQDIRALSESGYDVIVSNSYIDFFKCNYDFIFVWWWSRSVVPLLFSKILRVPIIFNGAFHYSTPLTNGGDFIRNSLLYKIICRLGLKYGNANIFPSECEFRQVVCNLPVSNPEVVYHGIDINRYKYNERDFDFTNRRPELLVISWIESNNIERKCLREVVDALNYLYKSGVFFDLYILGRVDNSGVEFVNYCRGLECSNNIFFTGHVSEEMKLERLRSSDIYISPTRYEGFGVAIAEAMATGSVVVTSANGAVGELADDTVIYVDPFDSMDIAAQLQKLLSNSDLCRRLSAKASQRICEKFSYDIHRKSLIGVINKYFR